MSVALDLDSLLAPQPAPRARPSLRLVAGQPVPGRVPLVEQPEREATVAVLHAPSPATIAAPLRLTRRGVAVLAALTAAGGALLVWAAALSAPDAAAAGSTGTGSAGTGSAGTGSSAATVTVRSGDTLWAIASRIAPGRDPRAEVADLRRLNHLADPGVMPGQVLRVR